MQNNNEKESKIKTSKLENSAKTTSKNSNSDSTKNNTSKKEKWAVFWQKFLRFIKTETFRIGAIAASMILVLVISIGVMLGNGVNMLAKQRELRLNEAQHAYDINYKTTTAVGYGGSELGTVKRNIPTTTQNEGLTSGYPTWGKSMGSVLGGDETRVAARNALVNESSYLTATGTKNGGGGGYTFIDQNGYLYSGTTQNPQKTLNANNEHRKLYKHSASVGLYLGNVSDSEPGVIKEVKMRPRGYDGYGVTGVYAPAGEVIKVIISKKDMDATGGLTFHIGQALFNGQANNIWSGKNVMNRMPIILNTLVLNKNTTTYNETTQTYTGYIGSFLGGPIYIRNTSKEFTVTISGAVNYPHFILGYTTKAEYEKNAKSSAPYFDLEVWSFGVLHSGPFYYAKNFSYNDIYNAAILWEKVSNVTTYGSSQGIVFIYDCFVAAGAAVAFPGRRSVNCPVGWMANSLNYKSIITSGAWGNFHEYHHNFQGFGVGAGGEVTNNAMTLVSYALFTKISSSRNIGSYGAGGLSGWNTYTSATWALDQTKRITAGGASNGTKGLALYATLLHNFGPDAFMQAKFLQQNKSYGESYAGYLRAWQEVTHNDMSYYFNALLGAGLTTSATSYPMFVPVSCVYQTGRSYNYDGEQKQITTMQPYVIPFGQNFILDLRKYTLNAGGQYESGSVVLPEGFTFSVKNTPTCEHGKIVPTGEEGVYTYIPDTNYLNSGKINVTLQITKDDSAFSVEDVNLTLGLEQSHEMTKFKLERTTYTYEAGSCYTDACTAFESNYAGYTSVVSGENINRTQNCNSDIWYTDAEGDVMPQNSVVELKGKMYADESGKYRIAIRGRRNIALYVSLDNGKTYEKAASYINPDNRFTFPETDGTYKDYELQSGSWLYFKAVMITGKYNGKDCFIGVGWGKFIPEQGTINEDTGEIDNYAPERVTVNYATAYRQSYQSVVNNFNPDYMYTRNYSYTYGDSYSTNINDFENISIVQNSGTATGYPLENLIDDNPTTFASSLNLVSEANPWSFTIDLGKTITANRFILNGYLYNNSSSKNQTPKTFILYVGTTKDNLTEIANIVNGSVSGTTIQFNFTAKTFRYYKLVIKGTVEGRYASITNITFSYSITGKHISPDSSMLTYTGSWRGKQAYSSFGHIYIGQAKSVISFKFTGTELAILSSKQLTRNFVVYIDGVMQQSVDIRNNSDILVSYLSKKLNNAEHSVKIVCLAESNIDSIVIF